MSNEITLTAKVSVTENIDVGLLEEHLNSVLQKALIEYIQNAKEYKEQEKEILYGTGEGEPRGFIKA